MTWTSLVAQTVKVSSYNVETWVRSWVGKIPWRRKWQPTPVVLPGKSHGRRSLVGCSPWSHKESDTTEQLTLWGAYQVAQQRKQWQPTPVLLRGESQGWWSLGGCCLWGLHRVRHDWSDLAAAAAAASGSVVKSPPTNPGDTEEVSLLPGSGRSPGIGNGNPLQ